jgi:serine/threonine-protein kinase
MSDKTHKESTVGKRFGRYLILDHLVDGGMAKIFRARFLGEKADKIVAIKMVQPQFSKDKNFQEMFDVELKLAFGLHHPNICQTYDYGQNKGVWYTAMEYIDGKNIKQISDRLKKRHEAFPLHLASYIISQVCQGLYYAHTFTDKLSGEHYRIIHRDISPHNVMITHDGAVKVIDFGIAKTEVKQDSTQVGTIKGKLSYLAPEYIEGQELDQRYDMFAVGITLWEMLCGRKLFVGTNDLSIIAQIRECQIPTPSSINPTIPQELDHIVLKALSKDRDLRYRDMNALCKAILRFLYTHFPDFNPMDLAEFTRELFSEEIKRDREKLREFGRMDVSHYMAELNQEKYQPQENTGLTSIDPATVEKLITQPLKEKMLVDDELEGAQSQGQLVPPKLEVKQKKSSMSPPPGPMVGGRTRPLGPGGMPRSATIPQGGARRNQGSSSMTGTEHILNRSRSVQKEEKSGFKNFALATFATVVLIYSLDKLNVPILEVLHLKSGGSSADRSISSTEKVALTEENSGIIYFENYDPSMKIFIEGKAYDYSPLGIRYKLTKKLIDVSVVLSGGQVQSRKVNFDKGRVTSFEITGTPVKTYGYLTIRKEYEEGAKFVYKNKQNKVVEQVLPLRDYEMPPGGYKAFIKSANNKILDELNIDIQKDRTNVVDSI